MKKWINLILDGDETSAGLVVELLSKDYKLSDWIIDISRRLNSDLKREYELWSISLGDLGFDGPTKIKDFYAKLENSGYSLVPPEIAFILRMKYKNQPTSEWLRIATPLNSMIDRDGILNKKAPKGEYITTWEDFVFLPESCQTIVF